MRCGLVDVLRASREAVVGSLESQGWSSLGTKLACLLDANVAYAPIISPCLSELLDVDLTFS